MVDDEAERQEAARARLDELVDEASRESFPASDPPAIHLDPDELVRTHATVDDPPAGQGSQRDAPRRHREDRSGT